MDYNDLLREQRELAIQQLKQIKIDKKRLERLIIKEIPDKKKPSELH